MSVLCYSCNMSNETNQRQHGQNLGASKALGVLMGHDVMEALDALTKREADLKKWLADHRAEIEPQAHLEANSREQVYWRYGYVIALRDAINLLQKKLTANQITSSAGTSN